MAEFKPSEKWTVYRHGGRGSDRWRCLYEGTAEAAQGVYNTTAKSLRQGGVRLLAPQQTLEKFHEGVWAPRLRRHW